MANQQTYVHLFLIVFFSAFAYTLHAFQFTVGGKDGWVQNPSENYNHWAERTRFQVNDTLLFKYKKGSDSVLVVNKDDYEKCNTEKPILKLEDGNSVFKFNRSGHAFFISGNKSICVNGQKLVIIVLAVRNRRSPPPPPPPQPGVPSPTAPPNGSSPAPSPLSPSPPADQAPAPATADGPSPGSAPGGAANTGGHPPPRPSFATPAAGVPSVVLVSAVSLVLSVCLGGFNVVIN